jgi:diguanylate cyclase (GGDEF)-like protein/PAS domain S-box-containing protein
MSLNGRSGILDTSNGSSWFTSEVQTLQGQMAALQSALESSKHAVEAFHRRAAENLEASEQRYRDLFNNVLTGVYRIAPDGRILLANPALVRMLGYESLDELDGQRFTPPSRLVSSGPVEHVIGFERTWRKRTGERINVREACRTVRDDGGAILYYEGVVEDITGQKKAELFERDCRTLLERVARNEPIERVMLELSRLIERQIAGASCCVMVVRQGKLFPIAAPTLSPDYLNALSAGVPVVHGAGSNAAAVMSGQVSVTEDILTSPLWSNWRDTAQAHGIRSCWSIPICSGREIVLGTLSVYHPRPIAASYADIQILETTSRLASVALEHRQLCEDLERQATRDRLTGLPNRLVFEEDLSRSIDDARLRDLRVAVLWIDLDRFKEINDTLGHQVGDELIRLAAARILPEIPRGAKFARTGGDEFATFLTVRDANDAEVCAARLLECLHAPFQLNGFELFVTASIGIALYPDHGSTASELQQNADAAMYRVKSLGKDGYALYEPALGETARNRMEVANSLRRALERNEFELHYQPQVDLDGNIRAFEALVRWKHPTRGLLYPGHFISIAEDTGLIVPIGSWVIEEACRQCAEWNANRSSPLKVAVNVSALQFYFSDLVEVVRTALVRTGLEPWCLELEVTESLVMKDAQQSAQALDSLRELGVTIAIDDFGTGYSSLSYLRRLPVDLLKIDRSFLENIDSRSASAIVEAITALAHALGLRVIAEGIEKHDQMSALRRLGVDLAQGYLIGYPLPAERIEELVRMPGDLQGPANSAAA